MSIRWMRVILGALLLEVVLLVTLVPQLRQHDALSDGV